MTQEQIQSQVQQLGQWFHNMQLGGVMTAPDHFLGDYPNQKWRRFAHAIPQDLTGKTVLDVGCNAGFYSIEMKKRGAARVLGIDFDERYLAQARFAAEISGADIQFETMTVYDVARLQEQFDLVLFLGVLYHLRHPLLALDLLHDHVVKDLMVMQTMLRGSRSVRQVDEDYPFEETVIFNDPGFPKMSFVENSYSHDPTNWWIPNKACVEAMVRSSGFTILDNPEDEVYVCRKNPSRSSE